MITITSVSQPIVDEVTSFIWGQFGNSGNREFYADCIAHSLNPNGLPRFYVATEGDTIVGCFALLTNDLVSRQDLMPWIACIYVIPECRGRGIGGMLLKHGLEEARRLGFHCVYTLTDNAGYYERYGWEYTCDTYDVGNNKGMVYFKRTEQ